MNETLDVLRLFGGFVYLVLGGDLLVRGALGISRRMSVSPVIVGLTVVAFGTSAPEFVISVYATATGYPGVALGNVVGSNIANILLVLGIPALISPIHAERHTLGRHTELMVLISIIFVVMTWNGVVSRIDGAVLLVMLAAMMAFVYQRRVTVPGLDVDDEDQYERVLGLPTRVLSAIGFVALGVVLLPLGADLTVEGATALARRFSIPEVVIGSTVVALGTSLPELTTTVIAAFHRSSAIALGNVIGSNVFNILLVAGTSAIVAPLPVPAEFRQFDLWVMLGASLFLLVFVLLRLPVNRFAGLLLSAGYVAYIVFVI